MKSHYLLLSSISFSLLFMSSCDPGRHESDEFALNAKEEEQEKRIKTAVKIDALPKSADQAPFLDVPFGSVLPRAPLLPVPPGLPIPALPVPIPVVEDNDRDDRDSRKESHERFCGDGIRQDGEQCDDSDDDDGDGCDRFCRIPRCGNGIVEGKEECDSNHIDCVDCKLILCGNNKLDIGETCDPPNHTTCNCNCQLSICGNGIVELSEECDDGNAIDDGNGCSAVCKLSIL